MSELTLPVIDKTIHKTRLWLDDVMAVLETTDRAKAYRALRAVLHALRDCLSVEETADFASQMPLLVRGMYYEGWKPSPGVGGCGVTDFVAKVGAAFGDFPTLDLERVTRSTFRVIRAHISEGEIDDVLSCLPAEVQDFLVADQYRARCQPLC